MDYESNLKPYGVSIAYHHQPIEDCAGATSRGSGNQRDMGDMREVFRSLRLLTMRSANAHQVMDGQTCVEVTSMITREER